MEHIASDKNPKVKFLVKLRTRKFRQQERKFLVEGLREIERALACGMTPYQFYAHDSRLTPAQQSLAANLSRQGVPGFALADQAFSKIAVRESTEALVATFNLPEPARAASLDPAAAMTLIADNIEKPGNLGAIMRTADGAGLGQLIVVGKTVDAFSPQVIRASLGTVFGLKIVTLAIDELVEWLRTHSIPLHAAHPIGEPYWQQPLGATCALVLGSEADGVSKALLTAADHKLSIPMAGVADSLNVSAAAAILIYDALRQRSISSP